MERVTVPFSVEHYQLDLQASITLRGIVRLEADALVIECRETRTSLNTLKEESGAVFAVRIPVADLDAVEWSRSWIRGGKLRIRTRTLSALENMPGAVGNELTLPVRRRDRLNARGLAVHAALMLSGLELKRLEDGEGTPPG